MATQAQSPYKDVRSLMRGLKLIEALSEMGWARIGEVSAATNIDRSSAYRIINTLVQLGYVSRREEDAAVALSPKFAYLADGLRDDDITTQFVWPALFELSRDVLWPCDFASFETGRVLIRLSTHKISPMSIHRGMVGKERLLARSALGAAILAAMPDDELETALDIIAELDGLNAQDVQDRGAIHELVRKVRSQGYASSEGQMESKISAIALPVRSADRRVVGAINIVFFRSAMRTEQAADRYLAKLRTCVEQVERSLVDFAERRAVPT